MDTITYNIPCTLVDAYREKQMVIRSHRSSKLLACLSVEDLEVASIQLISLTPDDVVLNTGGVSVPVDLVLVNPAAEFPMLYQWARMPAGQPVRVSIPVVYGFNKAVRLAVSLNLYVKLVVDQPDDAMVAEMFETLDYYLHTPTVSQPIDFFHSLLMAFYHGHPTTLWQIQEEDPAFFRYVSDKGEETLSARFVEKGLKTDPAVFGENFPAAVVDKNKACRSCDFRTNCSGYFKWPRKDYDCTRIKKLLQMLRDAAEGLKKDLARWSETVAS